MVDVICQVMEDIEPKQITESASFEDDLGAKSLELIDIIEGVEEQLAPYDVKIPDEVLEDIVTVRDAVDAIMSLLRPPAS